MNIRKQQSHGKIGKAAVAAKCWMHGIRASSTAGLRADFADSDLVIDTDDPKRKLFVQVKTGYTPSSDWVYMTQCSGEKELGKNKFVSDFVVFVNLDKAAATKHTHNGELDFHHLTFYVVPGQKANTLYMQALQREHERPLIKTGGQRKLENLAVNVAAAEMTQFKDAWRLIRNAGGGDE